MNNNIISVVNAADGEWTLVREGLTAGLWHLCNLPSQTFPVFIPKGYTSCQVCRSTVPDKMLVTIKLLGDKHD